MDGFGALSFRVSMWGALLLATAAPAWGVGDLYAAGDLGIAATSAESGGVNTRSGLPNTGDDQDSSPRYGGTLGVEWPMDRTIPWDIGLPSWNTRFELEAIGGRSFELTTDGALPYNSKVNAWSIMNNLWLDIPIHGAVAALFGRIPVLEPLSVNMGLGIGLSRANISVSDTDSTGETDETKFAYQAGAGIGYALTERVTFTIGYRYFDLGELSTPFNSGPVNTGDFSLDMQGNELSATLRVNFYALPDLLPY